MYPHSGKKPLFLLENINQAWDVPTATFSFDTDYSCLIDTVKPILDEKGWKATEFIIPLTVTLEQICELRDCGWSQGHQGYNHIDAFNYTLPEIEEDYRLGQVRCIENGFPDAQFYMAYGEGNYKTY